MDAGEFKLVSVIYMSVVNLQSFLGDTDLMVPHWCMGYKFTFLIDKMNSFHRTDIFKTHLYLIYVNPKKPRVFVPSQVQKYGPEPAGSQAFPRFPGSSIPD
jgi:hypothetical protein